MGFDKMGLAIWDKEITYLTFIRSVKSTPDPDTFEKYRDTPPISMAYFCKSMPPSWQRVAYTPPICITIRLPFVSRYFCKVLGSGVVGTLPILLQTEYFR